MFSLITTIFGFFSSLTTTSNRSFKDYILIILTLLFIITGFIAYYNYKQKQFFRQESLSFQQTASKQKELAESQDKYQIRQNKLIQDYQREVNNLKVKLNNTPIEKQDNIRKSIDKEIENEINKLIDQVNAD